MHQLLTNTIHKHVFISGGTFLFSFAVIGASWVLLTRKKKEENKVYKLESIIAGKGGKNTPLIFVPGGFHGAWCWHNLQDFFAEKNHCSYAISIRGHGKSEGKEELKNLGLLDTVKDLKDFIESLHLEQPPVLIGHSAGGGIIQKFAEIHPDMLSGLITIAAFPPFGGFWGFLNWFSWMPFTFLCGLLFNNRLPLSTPTFYKLMMFSPEVDDSLVQIYYQQLEPNESSKLPQDLVGRFVDTKRIKVPVLVIGGAQDKIFPPNMIKKAGKEYGTEAVIVRGAHDVMLDPYWRELAGVINNWLQKHHFST